MANTSRKSTFYFLSFLLALIAMIVLIIHSAAIILSGASKAYDDPLVAQSFSRGNIYDAKGRLIATDKTMWTLSVLLKKADDLPAIAAFIAPFTDQTPEQVLQICSGYETFARITRQFDPSRVESFLAKSRKNGYANALVLEPYQGRYYPYSYHAANLIGFVGWDGFGLEGIELSYESWLRAKGKLGEAFSQGSDLYLSLDMDIQYALDVAIQAMVDENPCDFAVAMIVSSSTGEIAACTSWPWYNPNRYWTYSDDKRNNLAFNAAFEPGSVFKVFSLASALEAGTADFDASFHCDGSYTFTHNGQSFTITCHSAHGDIDIDSMIAKSCNAAAAHWALQTEDAAFLETLTSLGFSKAPQTRLPATSGVVYPISRWSARSKATMAFGQELTASALQLCMAATAIANDGLRLDPVLVKSIESDGESVFKAVLGTGPQALSASTAQRVLEAMSTATGKGGTAVLAQVEGIEVAAKTGTSQLLGTEGGNLASTLAIVPGYVIYIAAYNPQGSTIWGANIASPAIADVVKAMASQGLIRYEGT